jgi:hypothetical protein
MADKSSLDASNSETFTSEAVRQRWELFHRAIAYAKKSNSAALQESETQGDETERKRDALSVAR